IPTPPMIEFVRHAAAEWDRSECGRDKLAASAIAHYTHLLRDVLDRARNAQQPDELRIKATRPQEEAADRGERDGERQRIQRQAASADVAPCDHDAAFVVSGPVMGEPHLAARPLVRVTVLDLDHLRRERVSHGFIVGRSVTILRARADPGAAWRVRAPWPPKSRSTAHSPVTNCRSVEVWRRRASSLSVLRAEKHARRALRPTDRRGPGWSSISSPEKGHEDRSAPATWSTHARCLALMSTFMP